MGGWNRRELAKITAAGPASTVDLAMWLSIVASLVSRASSYLPPAPGKIHNNRII